jgi:hypothetical protein
MWLLLTALAIAAPGKKPGKWDGVETDILSRAVLPAPAESLFSHVLELRNVQALWPQDCIGSWELGDRTYGEGASAAIRYDIGLMHRSLTMTLARAEATRYVEFDHAGNKGFITRILFAPTEGGTEVRLESYFAGPPKVFQGYYHSVMKPEWEGCHARVLDNLGKAVPAP